MRGRGNSQKARARALDRARIHAERDRARGMRDALVRARVFARVPQARVQARVRGGRSWAVVLADRLRQRLSKAVRGKYRVGSAVMDLGCDINFLFQYLAMQFQPGMSWDNYGHGPGKWTIDRIVPVSSVDLEDRAQLLRVCHYTNLQPLWLEDNVRKGDRVA